MNEYFYDENVPAEKCQLCFGLLLRTRRILTSHMVEHATLTI